MVSILLCKSRPIQSLKKRHIKQIRKYIRFNMNNKLKRINIFPFLNSSLDSLAKNLLKMFLSI